MSEENKEENVHDLEKCLEVREDRNLFLRRAIQTLRDPKSQWIKWEKNSLPQYDDIVIAKIRDEEYKDNRVTLHLIVRDRKTNLNDNIYDFLEYFYQEERNIISWMPIKEWGLEFQSDSWILVNKRLPEVEDEYLVTRVYKGLYNWEFGPGADQHEVRELEIAKYYPKTGEWLMTPGKDITSEVVAWLDLPKPYKEE